MRRRRKAGLPGFCWKTCYFPILFWVVSVCGEEKTFIVEVGRQAARANAPSGHHARVHPPPPTHARTHARLLRKWGSFACISTYLLPPSASLPLNVQA